LIEAELNPMALWHFSQIGYPDGSQFVTEGVFGEIMGYDRNKNWRIDPDEIVYYWMYYTGSSDLPMLRQHAYDAPYTYSFYFKPGFEAAAFSQGWDWRADHSGGCVTSAAVTDCSTQPLVISQVDEPSGMVVLIVLLLILAYLTVPHRRRASNPLLRTCKTGRRLRHDGGADTVVAGQ
jgi:hypothetical protein